MNITFQSVLDYGLDPTATLITEGFTGYFVPVQFTVASLLGTVRQDSVDLVLSRVILDEGNPVGVALIARRGWTSRLAAMSIVPHARGHGIGAVCVRQLQDEAKTRGDKAMVLEAIEQNTPAVRLYEKCGFQIQRRLVSYVGQPQIRDTNLPLQEIDLRKVARALIAYGSDDLPWQISGETLAHAGAPNVAFRTDTSYIALTNPTAPIINLRAIVTLPEARCRGNAGAILRAVFTRFPEKTWRVSAIVPEEFGGLFEKVGLERDTLSQWQMIAPL